MDWIRTPPPLRKNSITNLLFFPMASLSPDVCSLTSPEALTALLADDNRFGFIVMDGNGALFGTLQVLTEIGEFVSDLENSSLSLEKSWLFEINGIYMLHRS